MAAPLFTINQSIRDLYTNGIDSMRAAFGRPCRMVGHPPTPCPNCIKNADGTSAGKPVAGAARPFSRPPCPVCKGLGFVGERPITDAVFTVSRQVKPDGVLTPAHFTEPKRYATIKGLAEYLPAVMAADYIIVDTEQTSIFSNEYRLLKDTAPFLTGNIVAGRYFIAYLEGTG